MGKPTDQGVYVSQRLSFGSVGKVHGDSFGRQPDSGNPTVRDENGGLRKRGQVDWAGINWHVVVACDEAFNESLTSELILMTVWRPPPTRK